MEAQERAQALDLLRAELPGWADPLPQADEFANGIEHLNGQPKCRCEMGCAAGPRLSKDALRSPFAALHRWRPDPPNQPVVS